MGAIKFIAIDPGSVRTGFAVFELHQGPPRLITSGTILMDAKMSLPERLSSLAKDLRQILEKHSIHQMALESLFVAKNARSALHLAHARGVILMLAGSFDLNVFEYTPAEVKKTVTGMGRAQKDQIEKMIRLILKIPTNVKLSSADQADALAIGLTHAQSYLWKGFSGRQKGGSGRDRTSFWQTHL